MPDIMLWIIIVCLFVWNVVLTNLVVGIQDYLCARMTDDSEETSND